MWKEFQYSFRSWLISRKVAWTELFCSHLHFIGHFLDADFSLNTWHLCFGLYIPLFHQYPQNITMKWLKYLESSTMTIWKTLSALSTVFASLSSHLTVEHRGQSNQEGCILSVSVIANTFLNTRKKLPQMYGSIWLVLWIQKLNVIYCIYSYFCAHTYPRQWQHFTKEH